MSTENNLQTLYENSVKILADLIAFKTISGEDNNSLINYCDEILKKVPGTYFPLLAFTRRVVSPMPMRSPS